MKDNQIKGVMTELLENKNRKSSFDVFLSTEVIQISDLNEDSPTGEMRREIYKVLQNAKKEYGDLLNRKENIDLFKKMSDLETTIIQSRCAISTVTKLTQVNQKRGGSETSYVVARAPFHNPDTIKPEIRVYMGKTESFKEELVDLSTNKSFMKNAERQIVSAMKEIMEKSGAMVSIKKSAVAKQLVTPDGNYSGEFEEIKKEKVKLRSPFRPKPIDNPGPIGLSFLKNIKKG